MTTTCISSVGSSPSGLALTAAGAGVGDAAGCPGAPGVAVLDVILPPGVVEPVARLAPTMPSSSSFFLTSSASTCWISYTRSERISCCAISRVSMSFSTMANSSSCPIIKIRLVLSSESRYIDGFVEPDDAAGVGVGWPGVGGWRTAGGRLGCVGVAAEGVLAAIAIDISPSCSTSVLIFGASVLAIVYFNCRNLNCFGLPGLSTTSRSCSTRFIRYA